MRSCGRAFTHLYICTTPTCKLRFAGQASSTSPAADATTFYTEYLPNAHDDVICAHTFSTFLSIHHHQRSYSGHHRYVPLQLCNSSGTTPIQALQFTPRNHETRFVNPLINYINPFGLSLLPFFHLVYKIKNHS